MIRIDISGISLVFVSLGLACGEPAGRSVSAVVDGPLVFAEPRDIGDGVRGLSAITAADLNGDGLADIGAFDGGKHAGGRVTFAWFESPDDPSVGSWTRHELTRPPTMRDFIGAAKFGDVDGDGDADLVVSMDNHSGATRSAYIYWLENPLPAGDPEGDWVVRSIADDMPVHHINDMELADMDGDSRLDVVVRALDPNQLQIHFQNGPSDWTSKTIDSSPFGAEGEGFAVGNIDGAGQLDLTICGHWLRAPSNPRTESYSPFAIDAEYKTINANSKEAVGDIDGDGRLDVVISPAEGYRGGGNHVLAWYRAPSDPTSASWERNIVETNMNGGHTVALADMDLDGDLDLVSGVAWSMWGQSQRIRIYYNVDGAFTNQQTIVGDKGLYSGVVVDLGNDGDLDLVGQDTYSGTSRPWIYVSSASEDAPSRDAGIGDGGVADTSVSDGGADAASLDASPTDANFGDGGARRDSSSVDDDAGPTSTSAGCSATGGRNDFTLLLLVVLFRRRRA